MSLRALCAGALVGFSLVILAALVGAQEVRRYPIAWTQVPNADNGYPETWEFEFSHDGNTWTPATLSRSIGSASWCWGAELESEHAGGYVRARASGPAGFDPWNRWLTVPEPSAEISIALGALVIALAVRTDRRRRARFS